MAQTLKFGNKVWAAKEDSVLAYNDINNNYKPLPFDFARASIGTRVNKDGLIETMGQDIARIDYTDSADGVLLLEPARTNLEDKSNGFSTWSSNSNITRTSDYIISPDGTQNATRLQFTANGFCANKTQALLSYTMSCYAKRNDSGTQNVGFFTNGSGIVNSAWEITSEWKRFSYTFPTLNGGAMGIAGNSGADISVFGFQLEGLASYPTSYIPTSGSTVTRAAETCNNSGNSEVFNDSEGVLFADIAALVNDNNFKAISVSDSSTSDRITLSLYQSSLYAYIADGGVGQFNVSQSVNSISQYHKVAIKYKTNDCAFWIDGFEVATDTSATMPTGLIELAFDKGDGNDDLYGKTKELGYYDTALTDAELETLTSYRNWVSMVNELNLNIIYNG